MITRRVTLTGVLTTLAVPLAATTPAFGQQPTSTGGWSPTRPITIVVPFAAGSGTDAVARILAELLREELGGASIVIDNKSYGTIRMHQERTYPGRVAATDLANPDFAMLARAFGAWSKRIETTAAFEEALAEARQRSGVRLLHCVTDVEQLSAAGATVSGLRTKS